PNPNNGQEFRISVQGLDELGVVQLILRDIRGRVIDSQQMTFDKRSGDFLWRTNGTLESGIYLMEVQSETESTTVRFLVK
ncbi:MAG: T9SS type A sorting domain-containing protein, partial [Flavobacteriales bacterium]|nr:T9SS type A sorting domain-containing protein [Flavobacteriales bacterium]